MSRPGFVVATSQKEASEIAEARPDLVHTSLRAAQDQRKADGRGALWVVQRQEAEA